jgi:hypothetical protein
MCIRHQVLAAVNSTLKLEDVGSFETFIHFYHTTRRHTYIDSVLSVYVVCTAQKIRNHLNT